MGAFNSSFHYTIMPSIFENWFLNVTFYLTTNYAQLKSFWHGCLIGHVVLYFRTTKVQ